MTDQPDALEAIAAAADELIPQLAERLRRYGIGEIEVTRGDLRLRVTAGAAPAPGSKPAESAAPATRTESAAASPASGAIAVASPAVGFFVYADGLGPGLAVGKGDALGHVEMLGVRHEVRAPRGGTVRHLIAESGEAVEYGQIVVELDPGGTAS